MLPLPSKMQKTGSGTSLSDGMVIAADEASTPVATLLGGELAAATGWRVHTAGPGAESSQGTVRMQVAPEAWGTARTGPAWPAPAAEAYRLRVSSDGIDINAPCAAGVFYATRALRQLLPAELLRAAPVRLLDRVDVGGVDIEDRPRFGWRGMLLDVSRHFFPKDFLLKMVDLLSLHRMNVLHLHLTDDQGWRVQIDRYPHLTEIGAWRPGSPDGYVSQGRQDFRPHGGYYTKADLAEVVAYAARRFVTVVPEIDMPGHMQAAIASYPELGNTGRHLPVFTEWGISDHVLNMEESTVRFCAEVLEEVMELFPAPFVHIGGDECPTTEWVSSPRVRQLALERGLAGAHTLQKWFTAEMAKVVAAKGKRLIGWEEVLETGAPEGAVIAVWRQDQALAAALKGASSGHDVIMAPEPWTYFDWYYSDDPREPIGPDPVYRGCKPCISVEKAYSFEPVPAGLPPELEGRVIGAQCQVWTEYIPTPQHAEYMIFPRACATAEVAWSGPERDWPAFEARLRDHLSRLDALGVNYRPLSGPTPGQAAVWPPA